MGHIKNDNRPTGNKRKDAKSIRFVYLAVILGAFVVWFIALIIRSSLFSRGFSLDDILDRILDNLLGIIPPIILINVALDYYLRDFTASEISEQITTTLMGESDAINLFEEKTRINFVNSTIISLMGKEKGRMVSNLIEPYFNDGSMNLRKSLNYKIVLQEFNNVSAIFSSDRYIKIKENVKYSVTYNTGRVYRNKFNIGFFRDDIELDTNLRAQYFIFSEILHVNIDDLRKLAGISSDAKMAFVNETLKLHVRINDDVSTISKVEINEKGIFVTLNFQRDPGIEVNVDIGFSMPWSRGQYKYFVAIKEPTYQPKISLDYLETMSVSMIPFMNGKCSSERCTLHEGTCEVLIENEWIVPSSGVAFFIDTEHAMVIE